MIELGSGTLYISNNDGTCNLLGNLHDAKSRMIQPMTMTTI